MFFGLDKYTGRLAPVSQRVAYNPQSLLPYQEPARLVFENRSVQPSRGMAGVSLKEPLPTTKPGAAVYGVVPSAPGYRKVIEFQRKMLQNDGRLVWQKLPRDRAAYYITVGACAAILALVVNTTYRMAFNKK